MTRMQDNLIEVMHRALEAVEQALREGADLPPAVEAEVHLALKLHKAHQELEVES